MGRTGALRLIGHRVDVLIEEGEQDSGEQLGLRVRQIVACRRNDCELSRGDVVVHVKRLLDRNWLVTVAE